MADDQLSAAELDQLKDIAKSLPPGHPAANKVNLLLNSQPTQFEKDRPGTGINLEGAIGAGTETVKNLGRGVVNMLDPTTSTLLHPSQMPIVHALHEAKAGFERGGEGPPSRFTGLSKIGEGISSGLGSLVGVSGRREAEHAARGEGGAVIGETAVPAAAAAAGYALPKVLPKISNPIRAIGDFAVKNPAAARLVLGGERASALRELLTPPETGPKVGPGAAGLKPIAPTEIKPLTRAPEDVFRRPIEAAPGAGKEPAPSEMHPDELAEIRKEAGKPEMSAEEAHRFRVNKMASTAAAAKPTNELGGMKRAGDVAQIPESGPKKLPTLFQKEVRPTPIKLENLVDQAAGVKPLKVDVPLREQLSPQTTEPGEVVDPIKAKYPDPAVRQMVRANGEKIYEAAKGKPETVKAIHDLTRVELRQALINAGEDMGQTTISNSKFAGEGSIPREEAFNRLLEKGLKPDDIVKLAKRASEKPGGFMPEEAPQKQTRKAP